MKSAANEHTYIHCIENLDGQHMGNRQRQSGRPKYQKDGVFYPPISLNGVIATHIHQGGIIAARFEWLLENEVFPRCGQYADPNSVLIMDG